MSGYEHVLLSRAAGVGTITLNRPDKLNAFAGKMREEVAEGDDAREGLEAFLQKREPTFHGT